MFIGKFTNPNVNTIDTFVYVHFYIYIFVWEFRTNFTFQLVKLQLQNTRGLTTTTTITTVQATPIENSCASPIYVHTRTQYVNIYRRALN